jgi:hypothetical protein
MCTVFTRKWEPKLLSPGILVRELALETIILLWLLGQLYGFTLVEYH